MTARDGLNYRIVDGPVDLDVTAHVRGTPELTWNAVGGCETARLRVDLPLSTFPTLGRRSRLIVTDHASRPVWDGYCTDPGGVDDDAGEAFDLTADGSMSAASLRVGRLVYADRELGSWTRAKASVETAQTGQVDDDTFTGWRIGHPQGQVIGTGAVAGIEYRRLGHADHGIGRVALTATGHADDAGYELVVTTFADGTPVDSFASALSDTPLSLDLVAGDDIGANCDAVQVAVIRVGAATNVTTAFAFVDIPTLIVEGALVDQWGDPVPAGAPVTSARVVADLAGRGLLGPIDPDAAVIVDSGVEHTRLDWSTGIRGSAALERLREDDTSVTWMYGPRRPGGYEFTWAAWAAGDDATGDRGVRYDLTDQDTITSTGTTDLPADSVMVIYTDTGGDEQSLVVELPGVADVEFARDLDPIVLGVSTPEVAAQAGLDALTAKADAGRTVTAVVSRQVLDRSTGLRVEPHELRPGSLARLEATGEILRVQTVTWRGGDAGGTAELTLGDPAVGVEYRMLAVIRGEVDPTAPLIPPRSMVPVPPNTTAPINPDLEEQIEGALTTANGKNKITGATRAPNGGDAGVEGDLWYYFAGGNIYAVYTYTSGSWTVRKLRDETIDTLTVGKVVGLNAAFLDATIDYLTSVVITSSTMQTATSGSRIVIEPQSPVTEMKLYYGSETYPATIANIGGNRLSIGVGAGNGGMNIGTSAIQTDVPLYVDGLLDSISLNTGAATFSGAVDITGGLDMNFGNISGVVTLAVGTVNATTVNATSGGSFSSHVNMNSNNITNVGSITGSVTLTGSPTWNYGGSAGGTANVNWNGGQLRQITSSRRYKTGIDDLVVDLESIYKLRPRRYTRIGEGEEVGFIAEEALDAGLEDWVTYNAEGEVESFDYYKYVVALQAAVRSQDQRIRDLEARVDHLSAAIDANPE